MLALPAWFVISRLMVVPLVIDSTVIVISFFFRASYRVALIHRHRG
jgi:hypothetical protein